MCLVPKGDRIGHWIPLQLEFQMVVNGYVGVRNQTQIS